jgi:pimeloyl-ACP methyl ester carboxylesterase
VKFTDCSNLFDLSAAGIPASRAAKLTVSCARVPVPLDYAHPTGPSISIGLIRLHYADQTNRIGSLLVNPGGPGASGVFLAIGLAASLSDDVLQHFDLVGFDPRGVGLSAPLTCLSDAQKDQLNNLFPDVRTAAGFSEAKQASTTLASACNAKYGAALADYNTVATARDMDRIRTAVGDSTLNYLGYSYGTRLGSVYAHLFPTHIRVAALDGPVDPVASDLTTFANQLKGFESAFDQFAADCLTRPECKVLGNPRQDVYQLVAKANATPIPTSARGDDRKASGAIVLTGVLSALYDQTEWSSLGDALIQAQHGDAKGLFALADQYNERDASGHYSNIDEANTAISCNDSPVGPSDATIRTTAAQWAKAYPMFGLWSAATLFSCQVWQPDRHPLPAVSAPGSPPILVIGTIHDPATPYAAAGVLAKALGTGRVLTWDGEGHTAYGKSDCIDQKVNAYLINRTVPAAGTVCPR